MNVLQFRECQKAIVIVLKKKYTNLSVVEAMDMANEMLDELIKILNIEQK